MPEEPEQFVRYSKTVSESDVCLFAGITGDLSPVHVNAEWMKRSEVGERIAHGGLTAGLMSAASSRWVERFHPDDVLLSYGYDRMRFVRPVRLGDAVTVTVSLRERRPDARQLVCDVEATNQHGDVVAVAQHILAQERKGSGDG